MTDSVQLAGKTDAGKVKPRLLLLTHYYPAHRGGVEIVAGQLAARLADCYEILWLAADCDPVPNIKGVACEPQRAWNGLEKKGLPWPIWSLRGWINLKRAIAECDILHIHDFIYPAHLLAIPLARRYGKAVVVTQHIGDIEYNNCLLRGVLKAVNRSFGRWVLGRANQVIFISPRVKAGFEAYTNFASPSMYWPNGVDAQIFCFVDQSERAALRSAHGLCPLKPVLLFVGRFVERKGLHLMLQMAAARPEWQWCFAGWGPLDPAAWNLPNVRVWEGLHGESLASLYQLADLLILPSHGEGFPLVVQESLACGTPVVISEETAAGGPKIPGCIISVPCTSHRQNADTWLGEIQTCLRHDEIEVLRSQCAEMAELLWNWDRLAEKYQKLFRQLLSSQ